MERRPGEGASQSQGERVEPNDDGSVEVDAAELNASRQILALMASGQVVELRAIVPLAHGNQAVESGYFNDFDKLTTAARKLDGNAKAIYFVFNRIDPALLARAHNRIIRAKSTTSDNDVVRRHFLLIDVDPVRASGISSTDEEKTAACGVLAEIQGYLAARGFSEPIVADSGNGYHLLYRVDLPAADADLVKKVLHALAFLFDTDAAKVDTTVHSAAQLTKLYGTMVRKGDETPDRRHRRSRVISTPEQLVVVPEESLQALAAMLPPEPPRSAPRSTPGSDEIDINTLLARANLSIARQGPWKGGTRWVFAVCPFDAAHTDRSAYLIQFASGALAAGCHHNGCREKSWRDLGAILDPSGHWRARSSDSSGSAPRGEAAQEWPEPEAFVDELPPVAACDPELVPLAFRPWLLDIAQRIQCPLDFLAASLLVALAAVVGRRVGIRPKCKDDWIVIVNLWGMLIGRPGILKTPAVQEVLRALNLLDAESKEEFDSNVAGRMATEMVEKERAKIAQKQIRDSLQGEEGAEGDPHSIAKGIIDKILPAVTRRRRMLFDTTVEKLGELLKENPNGLLIFRDELIGFLRSLDKEGHECDRSFYLEAWNGNGRFTYDRIGRGTIDIEAAIVSILGCIQPGPLCSYLRDALDPSAADDGFIQRFQIAVWPDVSRKWKNVDQWPNAEARNSAFEVFKRLDSLDPKTLDIEPQKLGQEHQIPALRFTPEAQARFDAWREKLEHRVRGGSEHPALESHFAKYRSLIPSIALLLHLAEGERGRVGDDALKRALLWADYLESHARRIYSVGLNPDVTAAKAIERHIASGDLKNGFTLREVYRPQWAGLRRRDDAERGVNLLMDMGWLRSVTIRTAGAPKLVYSINPKLKTSRPDPDRTDTTDKRQEEAAEPPPEQQGDAQWGEV